MKKDKRKKKLTEHNDGVSLSFVLLNKERERGVGVGRTVMRPDILTYYGNDLCWRTLRERHIRLKKKGRQIDDDTR